MYTVGEKVVHPMHGAGVISEITEDTAINLVDGNITEKEGGLNRTVVNKEPKVGRNDDCPCRKWKKI